jgi:hypothetical protein
MQVNFKCRVLVTFVMDLDQSYTDSCTIAGISGRVCLVNIRSIGGKLLDDLWSTPLTLHGVTRYDEHTPRDNNTAPDWLSMSHVCRLLHDILFEIVDERLTLVIVSDGKERMVSFDRLDVQHEAEYHRLALEETDTSRFKWRRKIVSFDREGNPCDTLLMVVGDVALCIIYAEDIEYFICKDVSGLEEALRNVADWKFVCVPAQCFFVMVGDGVSYTFRTSGVQ